MDLYVGSFWGNRQWGLGNPSINFPIAFPKECFIAAITRAAGNYEHSIVITTKNKTNLSWICKGYDNSAGNTYANWLALGCQLQWGFDSGTAEKNIVILPLPVINPLSGFACLTDSNGAGDIGIKSMSSTSIVVDVDTNKAASRNFYWLVIAL